MHTEDGLDLWLRSQACDAQDMYSEVVIPDSLKGNKSFEFLQRDLRRSGLMGGGNNPPTVLGGTPLGAQSGSQLGLNVGPGPPNF
jgi:hypothetical protein